MLKFGLKVWEWFTAVLKGTSVTPSIGVTFPLGTGYHKEKELLDMSQILIERMTFTDKSTIGELSIDGEFYCYTLERTCRKTKDSGPVAIESGRYKLGLHDSPRFKRIVPILKDVPGRSFILIHPANKPDELEGCIATGMRHGHDEIFDSRKAFDPLCQEIIKRVGMGDTYIAIVGGRQKEEFNVHPEVA